MGRTAPVECKQEYLLVLSENIIMSSLNFVLKTMLSLALIFVEINNKMVCSFVREHFLRL